MRASLIVSALLIFTPISGSAQDKPRPLPDAYKIKDITTFSRAVAPNAITQTPLRDIGNVYGVVEFTSKLLHGNTTVTDKDKYQKVLEGLLLVLREHDSNWDFMNQEGEFHFTIEVSAGNKELGRVQVLHNKVDSKKELFIFDSLYTSTATAQTNGTILKNYIVLPDTNAVRLSFKLYHSEKRSLDWTTFNSLSDLALKLQALSSVAPLAKEALKPLEALISKMFDNYKKKELNIGGEYAFVDFGGVTAKSGDRWTLNSEKNKPKSWQSAPVLEITVALKVVPSRLWDVDANGSFIRPVAGRVLKVAAIEGQGVLQIMSEGKSKDARALADAIIANEVIKEEKIRDLCAGALNYLLDGVKYTHRDAVLVYWALLHEYAASKTFRESKSSSACVADRKEIFALYGLSVPAIGTDSSRSSPTAVVPTEAFKTQSTMRFEEPRI